MALLDRESLNPYISYTNLLVMEPLHTINKVYTYLVATSHSTSQPRDSSNEVLSFDVKASLSR